MKCSLFSKISGLFYISFLFVAVVYFSSCKKELPSKPWAAGEPVVTGSAKLIIIHLSPNIYLPNPVDLKFNDGGVGSLNYNDRTAFFDVPTGTPYQLFNARTIPVLDSIQTVSIDTTYVITYDSIAPDPDTTLVIDTTFKEWWRPNKEGIVFDMNQLNAILEDHETYSCFITGDGPYLAKYLLLPNHNHPPSGTCSVRFINLSPDAPEVYVVNSLSDTLFDEKAFLDFSAPTIINIGSTTLDFKESGTGTTFISLPVTFEDGKIYNVYIKGLISGTGNQALGAELLKLN